LRQSYLYNTINTSLLVILAGVIFVSGCQHSDGRMGHIEQKAEAMHPALRVADKHPAVEIMSRFIYLEESDVVVSIIPYSVDLMALNLLSQNKDIDLVKRYLLWHLDHLNYPVDNLGLTATIYDYEVDLQLNEKSLEYYDSSDSYSAMFLLLLNKYYKKTGDSEIIISNRAKLEDIAYNIVALMNKDGLTIAKADYKIEYLMDNSEVYGGLNAFVEICMAFNWDVADYYAKMANNVKTGILQTFYSTRQILHWARDKETVSPSSWGKFYPDAYAQLMPLMHGVLDDFPELEQSLWENFNLHHAKSIENAEVVQKIVYYFAKQAMER